LQAGESYLGKVLTNQSAHFKNSAHPDGKEEKKKKSSKTDHRESRYSSGV
jgi:hypothetical protein